MQARLAKIITYIFHPVFLPVYGLLLLFNLQSYLTFGLVLKAKLIILAFVIVSTVIFPLLIIALMKRQGFLQSYEMKTREERRLPYLITAIFYFITYQMFRQMQLSELFSFYFMGATFLIAVVVIINFWWKISTHMAGMGGIAGMLTGLAFALSINLLFLIAVAFLISGLVGYARLKAEAHKSAEVYAGFLVGYAIMCGIYLMI